MKLTRSIITTLQLLIEQKNEDAIAAVLEATYGPDGATEFVSDCMDSASPTIQAGILRAGDYIHAPESREPGDIQLYTRG